MIKSTNDLVACPACGTEITLEHLVGALDDEQAFARLIALSIPMAHLVVQYISLFAPEKQRLTLRKKVRIIQQLLPDLRRLAITHKGRDWPAPAEAWQQAIEQMLAARNAGRLQVPMSGHGYLYATLAGMADKHEAKAEEAMEEQRRTAPRSGNVQIKGQTLTIGETLQPTHGSRDPVLVQIEADSRNAAPIPAEVRERIAQLRGKPTPK